MPNTKVNVHRKGVKLKHLKYEIFLMKFWNITEAKASRWVVKVSHS